MGLAVIIQSIRVATFNILCNFLRVKHNIFKPKILFLTKSIFITGVAVGSGGGGAAHTCGRGPWYSVLFQKYVLLTVISGGLSVILGSLFIAIYCC